MQGDIGVAQGSRDARERGTEGSVGCGSCRQRTTPRGAWRVPTAGETRENDSTISGQHHNTTAVPSFSVCVCVCICMCVCQSCQLISHEFLEWHCYVHYRQYVDTKCKMNRMSGYDSVNRNVSSRVRKVARDGADVTSSGRQFHTWGSATENARLPVCRC